MCITLTLVVMGVAMRSIFGLWLMVVAGAAAAQGWTEPQRGTALRSALMDALRPHAEWTLGAPVQFVVHDLRVSGGVAFASVWPQRPGGGEINLYQTPGYARGELFPDEADGPSMQALYKLSGETWVAVHWAIGATDVWWAYSPLCAEYSAVVPETC